MPACDSDRALPAPASPPGLAVDKVGSMSVSSDPSGQVATVSTTGSIDLSNPFFQSLGTNGRTCASCHAQGSAWGLSAAAAQAAYAASGGTDPLFAAVDGANCPSVTAVDGAEGHSLLLGNGLFRIALPAPAGAGFSVTGVHDPDGGAVPAGHYGLLLRLTLQSMERTLAGAEIGGATRRGVFAPGPLGGPGPPRNKRGKRAPGTPSLPALGLELIPY